jgi:UDP-N-acetylglucosamine acyltransferase
MSKIHPTAIVEDGARLGADVEIGPYCVIGRQVRLGDGVRLLSHVAIEANTEIGPRTLVHPHAVLGGPAQYRGDSGEGARLVIGADNVIREFVTINAGSTLGTGVTKVGDKGYFMAYSHIAHDCHVGNEVTFANSVALAGHVTVGEGVNIGGISVVHQFSRIGHQAFIGGMTGIPGDLIPYGMATGSRAHLSGLNLIGLKRIGVPRARIHALRAAYRFIFTGEGHLTERARAALERWSDCLEVLEVVDFIYAASKRRIMTPASDASDADDD